MARLLPTLALCALLALPAAGAGAVTGKPSLSPSGTAHGAKQRREASRALEKAEALRNGHGIEDGSELTPALLEVAVRLRSLQGSERRRALALLARPTIGQGNPGEDEYAAGTEERTYDSAHFRIHWVTSSDDAPDPAGSEVDGVPDYVETMAAEFERVYEVEHAELGWRLPVPDRGRGGNDLTDVYIKQLGDQGIFGYAAPDPLQQTNSQHAFLVLDNDYSQSEYTRYAEPLPPLRVTAAHEYNHVLQFAYDVLQDAWMFESTAVWMEDRVYDDVNDYLNYLNTWAELSPIPITQFNSFDPQDPGNAKVYGSGVWNRWLDERYGPDVVREAWESSLRTSPPSFAPGAYDAALRTRGVSGGFVEAFTRFVAETAEWRTDNFHEGETFPDMRRLTDEKGVPFSVRADGPSIEGRLDHTGWAYFDVQPEARRMKLVMRLGPKGRLNGPSGAVALVGRRGPMLGGSVEVFMQRLPRGGRGVVTIDNGAAFERLTAVLMNSDISISRFSAITNDWIWQKDSQEVTARVSTDFRPPGVRRRTPSPDRRGVSPTTQIRVRFSEPVEVDSTTFRLVAPGGRRLPARVTYDRRARRATLDPRGRLKSGKRYRAELTGGVVDLGANPLPLSQRRWAFVTR